MYLLTDTREMSTGSQRVIKIWDLFLKKKNRPFGKPLITSTCNQGVVDGNDSPRLSVVFLFVGLLSTSLFSRS